MPPSLPSIADLAREAVGAFLATFVGTEVSITATRADDALAGDAPNRVLLIGNDESGTARFAVSLEEGWAGVLSQAMLGETLPAAEATDLLTEVAGQAYGAFRTAAGQAGPAPPSMTFAAAAEMPALPAPAAVTFTWDRAEGESLGGALLLPEALLADASSPAAPEAAPAPSQTPPQQPTPQPVEVARAQFSDFGGEQIAGGDGAPGNLHILSDVELEVTVELGRRRIPLADVLSLTTGSIIELEKLVGQPLEVYANGRLIAEGEAVVIDEQFGVRVTSLMSQRKAKRAFL